MSEPAIRAATASDQDAVRALIFAILDEYELEPDPKSIDRDLFDLEAFYEDGAFDVLVSADGDIMGTVGLKPIRPGVCELRKMYLKNAYRGRGYGQRLLRHAIEKAGALGMSRIELETARVLKEAIGLYEKFGFQSIDHDDLERRCDTALGLDL